MKTPTENQITNSRKKASRLAKQETFRAEQRAIYAAQSLRCTQEKGPEKCPWEAKELLGEVCDELES